MYVDRLYDRLYPQNCLKLGCTVTQTSVIDFQINQSAHRYAI